MCAWPAPLFFDRRQPMQQVERLPGIAKFDHGIKELARALFAADRLGFVNSRRTQGRQRPGQRADVLSRIAQMREPLSEVGAKRDAGSHFSRVRPRTSSML